MGSWTQLGTLSFPANKFVVLIDNIYNTSFLFNVGIGASGSQKIVASNLFLQQVNSGLTKISFRTFLIQTGTAVWIQLQSSTASATQRISVGYTFEEETSGILTPLGIVSATTSMTPFSTGANAYGAWVSLGTLLIPGRRLKYFAIRDPSSLNTINIGVGASGAQQIILANAPVIVDGQIIEIDLFCPPGEYWIQLNGTEIYASQGAIWIES